jgi:tRNA1Val (adenine37-N6)-methyltransferase
MKVCTDACILGAIAKFDRPSRILDIGSGTGLLSLMLAQRYDCPIDAVEIFLPSCEESSVNVQNSPWGDRINIYCQPIQDFSAGHAYDLVISNPPFFHGQKKGNATSRNLAIHGDRLPLSDLAKAALRFISPHGRLFVLFPPGEASAFSKMMKLAGTHVVEHHRIRNSPGSAVFRNIIAYSYQDEGFSQDRELIIRDTGREYSKDFVELLRPYYLNL